jgi:D-aspartate ligase
MQPVILLGGNIIALGIARALALKGIDIILMRYDPNDMAQFSKYVKKSIHAPNPNQNENDYINFLLQQAKYFPKALLIPVNDDTVLVTSKYKQKLLQQYEVATPDYEIAKLFINKEKTYTLCKKKGIPHPKGFIVESLKELEDVRDQIFYPCIVKPCVSHRFVAAFNTKLFIIGNFKELKEKFLLCARKNHKVIIQEFIEGEDENQYGVFQYYDRRGKLLSTFSTQKIRLNPPRKGVARVAQHITSIPEIEIYAQRLLESVKYKGMAGVHFKYDPRDNVYKLIEVNIRLGRHHFLSTRCGVNFPFLMYNDLINGISSNLTVSGSQTYWIDLYAEAINFILRDSKEKWTIRDYMRPYRGNKVFAVYDGKDRKPFLMSLINLPFKYNRIIKNSFRN